MKNTSMPMNMNMNMGSGLSIAKRFWLALQKASLNMFSLIVIANALRLKRQLYR